MWLQENSTIKITKIKTKLKIKPLNSKQIQDLTHQPKLCN